MKNNCEKQNVDMQALPANSGSIETIVPAIICPEQVFNLEVNTILNAVDPPADAVVTLDSLDFQLTTDTNTIILDLVPGPEVPLGTTSINIAPDQKAATIIFDEAIAQNEVVSFLPIVTVIMQADDPQPPCREVIIETEARGFISRSNFEGDYAITLFNRTTIFRKTHFCCRKKFFKK
ncbi:hypothetical protein [Chengkuizengella axinellae]|uniref:Uncharacterized protein n=1 Tax=Chengkuizengella axinellae TaxID=3064388 RepID=A0ABT9J416_9BACL|nr:hypothetical protein [Chengkuizengella sp. 2205SS18-9]MDP5275730.1 hypothetical protein [Chengkuizengella sp. 2205SS18-9]